MSPRLLFQIHPSSGVPIYRQLMDQVRTLIAAGRLSADEMLPSVRQIAEDLQINPMTVSKAYSLLERDGVLERVRGQGMRVAVWTRMPGESFLQLCWMSLCPVNARCCFRLISLLTWNVWPIRSRCCVVDALFTTMN